LRPRGVPADQVSAALGPAGGPADQSLDFLSRSERRVSVDRLSAASDAVLAASIWAATASMGAARRFVSCIGMWLRVVAGGIRDFPVAILLSRVSGGHKGSAQLTERSS